MEEVSIPCKQLNMPCKKRSCSTGRRNGNPAHAPASAQVENPTERHSMQHATCNNNNNQEGGTHTQHNATTRPCTKRMFPCSLFTLQLSPVVPSFFAQRYKGNTSKLFLSILAQNG